MPDPKFIKKSHTGPIKLDFLAADKKFSNTVENASLQRKKHCFCNELIVFSFNDEGDECHDLALGHNKHNKCKHSYFMIRGFRRLSVHVPTLGMPQQEEQNIIKSVKKGRQKQSVVNISVETAWLANVAT